MPFYLDTADIESVKKLYRTLPIKGVTTNPTIIAKSGKPVEYLLPALQDIMGDEGLLFAQTLGESAVKIVEESLYLRDLAPNLVVKIPVTEEGLAAIKILTVQGIPTLGTAVYDVGQGLFAALAGARFVAPYVNRIDSLNRNGVQSAADIQRLIQLQGLSSEVLAASFKTPRQVLDCLLAGCPSVTIAPELARAFLSDPAIFNALDQFNANWQQSFHKKGF